MAKSNNKTVPTDLSVDDYLNEIDDPQRKEDCKHIDAIMREVTNLEPKMWGTSIVGYGMYHYKYESGREGDMPKTGFSNRKQSITLYIMSSFKNHDELLAKLGPHKTGKSCLYIKRLADINVEVLKEMIELDFARMEKKYNTAE